MSMNPPQLKNILEAALFASTQPLSLDRLTTLFPEDEAPTREQMHEALTELANECEGRGVELKEVGSGFRMQVRVEYGPWIARLWEEKPTRYSRALLETLALVAYKQPITRAEIEDVRGVAVSTHIIKTLLEREWVRVVGHRDVPGKPALYGTTREFLDYFNLKSLSELPPLAEIRNLEDILLSPEVEAVLAKHMVLKSETPESEAPDASEGDTAESAADDGGSESVETTAEVSLDGASDLDVGEGDEEQLEVATAKLPA